MDFVAFSDIEILIYHIKQQWVNQSPSKKKMYIWQISVLLENIQTFDWKIEITGSFLKYLFRKKKHKNFSQKTYAVLGANVCVEKLY